MPDNEPVEQTPEIPEVPEPENNETPTEQVSAETEEKVEEEETEAGEEEKEEEIPSPTEEGDAKGSSTKTLSKDEEKKSTDTPSSILIDEKPVETKKLISAWKERGAVEKLRKEGQELHDTAKYILEQIPKDPKAVFLDIMTGMTGSREKAVQEWVGLCEKEIYQQLKLAEMPEGDRKALQLEEQLKEERKRNEEFRKKEEAQTFEAMRAKRANEIFGEIKAAIKQADLSDNPEIVRRIATKMHAMAEDPTFTAADAAELVAEEEEELFKKLEIEKLQKKRPDLIDKVRKSDLEQIRSARMVSKKPQKAEAALKSGEKKPISSADFQDLFGR